MAVSVLTPEAILQSLTRIIHPTFGVDVVNLGTIYGIELDHTEVTITMAHAVTDSAGQAETESAIREGLNQRHPDLTDVLIAVSHDPAWREDFITPEGELQLRHPMPTTPQTFVSDADVLETLKFVIDPEVGVNVVDLGLIYGVDVAAPRVVVTMTLTTPGCPLHATIEEAVHRVIETRHPHLTDTQVNLVWEPAWDVDKITPDGKKALGW